jgi:hypothetical protein
MDAPWALILPEGRMQADGVAAADCFGDLHLDQIVAAITASKGEYDLAPFLSVPRQQVEAVRSECARGP